MEYPERDNYLSLITIPATDCNFKAALREASEDDLLRARDKMRNSPFGNKARLTAIRREIKRRDKEAES